ncbi:MAG: AAA family ATPase [Candidatus Micrarchaeota archaeon]|nr:AAA family ATPase [Candidatus Micrarchaeota archaeon]
MLYLKSLSLSKFKSFKSADLLFSKGFTCVVGPNGSGKSNICDALLFALGEKSLKRMRADNLESLITNSAKQSRGTLAKTHVKAIFDGDETIEVVRAARSDGKSMYKVNGKKMTRHEVLEILKQHKIAIDETNTITQGEISRMMDLNPRERRELIDIASGITEFEEKKKESLKELEKVNGKTNEVQAELNVRLGYLKELEKEKTSAENYTGMTTRLRLLKYNILVTREQEIRQNYDKYSRDLALLDSKKQKLTAEIDELSNLINKLNAERQQITKTLSDSTVSTGEEGKKLENVNKELALIDAALETNSKQIAEKSAASKLMKEEIEKLKETVAKNKAELSDYQKKISAIEPFFNDSTEEKKGESADNRMQSVQLRITKLEHDSGSVQGTISALQADLASTNNSLVDLSSRSQAFESHIKEKKALISEITENSDSLSKSIKTLESEITKLDARSREITNEIGEIDTRLLSLKEQRASQSSRESNISDRLNSNFKEKDGFYGRVSQLCSYGSEYSLAVEASAGARFDYFVVESIESASKIIAYLKKNELGRATFIPLKDLAFDRERKTEKSLSAVIDMLKFDSKYSKVFEYVFSNTFIIEKVEDSKKVGIGKHRYVTLAGELVEQSGVLSGGSARKRVSLASIENQLKELSSNKEKISLENREIGDKLFKSRKEKATYELEQAKISSHSSDIEEQIKEMTAELKKLEGTLKSHSSKVKELEIRIRENSEMEAKIVKELEDSRAEAAELYNKAAEAARAASKHGMSKEEKEKIKRVREELQDLKVKVAELQTANQMSEERKKELENQFSATIKSIEEMKFEVKDKEARKGSLEKSRTELEKQINNISASGKKATEKLHEIEEKGGKLNGDKGKKGAESDEIERQLNDIKLKRSQFEVRLVDLKAELAAYPSGLEKIEGTLEAMEKEANVMAVRIEQLGNVNLKAPEIYESRKKDVEDADSRLSTLVVEKDAIMKMIEEIDSKKLKIFLETFDAVNKNFMKLYGLLFPEKAQLELDNLKNPFEAGLTMKIPEGKSFKSEKSLSGGEKSLRLLVILFAIHMYKPSSIYLFDEVDAALDKENSKKLSHLIKELSKSSQFVVVSHNDSLIVNSDTAIGVSKIDGESRAVGLQVASVAKAPAAGA